MNRIRVFAIGTMLIFALTTFAQTAKGAPSGEHNGVPTAEAQLKLLAERLDLTADQQDKIKPILQELHDAMMKLVQDESMSRDQRLPKVRDLRYKADAKIRMILSDDQKQKLDQLEHEPHPELHGGVSGAQD